MNTKKKTWRYFTCISICSVSILLSVFTTRAQAEHPRTASANGIPCSIDKETVSIQDRTQMKRSDVICWFDNVHDQVKYDSDVIYQRMDIVSEFQVSEWQKRVKKWHSEGRIVHGCLNPLTQLGKIFEFVMNDPGLQSTVCLDFNLNPIITGWMAGRQYKGKPVHLYCGNHPTFRAWLRQQAYMIAEIGADAYHVDDSCGGIFAYGYGGCFCEYCMAGFRQYLQEQYSAAELKERGIDDIDEFNYRDMVLLYADDAKSFRLANRRSEIPLISDFRFFQYRTDAELFKSIREMGSKIRGKYMPMGWDNVQIAGTRGPYYDNLDIFYAEMEYDQFYLDEPREGRDFERARKVRQEIMPAAVVPHKFVDAIDKWYAPTPSPWSWAKIKELHLSGLLRQWTAFTYANGGFMRYPRKGWCFGETSRWYYPKQEDYEPIYAFIRSNPTLFDDYEAVEQVGVLYAHHPEAIGGPSFRPLRYVCGNLVEKNIPFGVVVAGDDWLSNRLQRDAIDRFELMLIPEPLKIEAGQKRIVGEWMRTQKDKVLHVKDTDNVGDMLKGRIEPLVSLKSNSTVWLFPRKVKNRDNAPVVCHVYNHQYDDKLNKMIEQQGVKISLSRRLFNGNHAKKVMYYSFEHPPVELPLKTDKNGTTVTISSIELWGVLKVEI